MTSRLLRDEVTVSTVDFETATAAAAGVGVGSPALENGETIASLDADGLLTYRPDRCGAITIANGATVKAIRMLFSDGSVMVAAEYDATTSPKTMRPLLLRAADGGSFTLAHDQVPPTASPNNEWEDEERLSCQFGNDVTMANAYTYVQFDNVAAARRWRVADWSVASYTPADSNDWNGDPTTVAEAIDRLAARLAVVGVLPIP